MKDLVKELSELNFVGDTEEIYEDGQEAVMEHFRLSKASHMKLIDPEAYLRLDVYGSGTQS